MEKAEIFSFEGGPESGYASSYYFQTPDGVFLFDGQLLKDEMEDLRVSIYEDIPNAPFSRAVITTAHPEHYASLSVLTSETNADVYSTKKNIAKITHNAGQRLSKLKEIYGPRMADTFPVVDRTIKSAEELRWPGQVLQFFDIGARVPAGNLICYLPAKKRLISGDLIFNKVHPNIDRVDPASWIRALDILSSFGPKTVYPGHGPRAGGDIITHLKRYLAHFRLAVSHFAKQQKNLDDDCVNGVLNLMNDKYPDYRLPENLIPGIVIEFERQVRKAA